MYPITMHFGYADSESPHGRYEAAGLGSGGRKHRIGVARAARWASTSVIGDAAWRRAPACGAACGSKGSEPGHKRGHNAQCPAGAGQAPSARDD